MRIRGLDERYHKEYLVSDEAIQVPFSTKGAFVDFFESFRPRLTFLKRSLAQYHIVIGEPLGLNEEQKYVYQVYGIADQAKNGYFLGRWIPPKMVYGLTMAAFMKKYKLTQNYALSKDHLTPTNALLSKIVDDGQTQMQGAIVDKKARLILLTTTLPDEFSAQLEGKERGDGSTKSTD